MEAGGVLQDSKLMAPKRRCGAKGKKTLQEKEWMGNDGVCLFLSTRELILSIVNR